MFLWFALKKKLQHGTPRREDPSSVQDDAFYVKKMLSQQNTFCYIIPS